jgi:hypothetical protein
MHKGEVFGVEMEKNRALDPGVTGQLDHVSSVRTSLT